MIELYDDQAELVERVSAAMRKRIDGRAPFVQMVAPTGSGKTVMNAAMMARAVSRNKRVVMTVPRKELLSQTAETMRAFDLPFGVIAAGHAPNPYAPIQLAMAPTLARRLDRIKPPDLLAIDESHYGGATMAKIIGWARAGGSYGLGLSATPWRLDGRGLGDHYDVMVEGADIAALTALGRLSDYRLFAPSAMDVRGIKTRMGDFAQNELATLAQADRKLIGDAVESYRLHAIGRLCVAYCVSVAHAEQVAEIFRAGGIPAESIDGSMSDVDRRARVMRFARRETLVLTNCDLLTFGFDLASAAQMDVTIEAMSDLRPTQSLALQMQKWGRVLRRKDFPAMILDHAGNWERHGAPDATRTWSLAGREKRKKGEPSDAPPIRQCPQCYRIHEPAPVCPECGHEYPIQSRDIETEEGDLVEINTGAAPAITPEQREARKREFQELIVQAKTRKARNPYAYANAIMARRRKFSQAKTMMGVK